MRICTYINMDTWWLYFSCMWLSFLTISYSYFKMTTTKIVIVLAVFITKVSTQTNTTNETTYMDLIRSLQHVIDINQAWRKCPQITNLERYRGILNDAQNCLRLAEGNQTLCGVLLNNYPTCFQPLVDYFVECLPERSKDYPHLAVRQIMAIIRVLCGSTGENLIVSAEGESSSSEEDLKSVASIVENKLNSTIITDMLALIEQTKKQCPDIQDKLDSTTDQVATCIDNIDLGSDTFCAIIRKNLGKCSEPVKKLLDGCLPEESKDLPAMGIKIISAIIDQACNSTVEEILELFNPCMMEKEFKSYEACTKVKDAVTEHKSKLPTKSLICSMLPNLTSCVKSHRDASCKNPVTKESLINFYEAIDTATASDCQEINKTK
ncbi:hypothetical protein NQ315_013140 [Exocentrus adspersus]|uniref:Uncharacterized protein n=1 Tax=Exocentrus adspersus TaxID=1586481 RepID=A0AAV8VWS0_9CUCU|nr:hypothetical protein NQ315_013140 [Exocentrus adspersus]